MLIDVCGGGVGGGRIPWIRFYEQRLFLKPLFTLQLRLLLSFFLFFSMMFCPLESFHYSHIFHFVIKE